MEPKFIPCTSFCHSVLSLLCKTHFSNNFAFHCCIFVNEYGQSNKRVLFIDPTISFWHTKHIILMAFSILLLVILPPILVLIAYPTKWFQKLQNSLSSRMNLAIQTFVSPFQGCFKDGTNGTRDYRALSGGILAVLLLMSLFSKGVDSFVKTNARDPVISFQIIVVMYITLSVGFAAFKPYKSDIANLTGVTLTALVAIVTTLYITCFTSGSKVLLILAVILSIPHFVFYGYLVYRIRQYDFKRRLQEWCCCYRKSENVPLLRHD